MCFVLISFTNSSIVGCFPLTSLIIIEFFFFPPTYRPTLLTGPFTVGAKGGDTAVFDFLRLASIARLSPLVPFSFTCYLYYSLNLLVLLTVFFFVLRLSGYGRRSWGDCIITGALSFISCCVSFSLLFSLLSNNNDLRRF